MPAVVAAAKILGLYESDASASARRRSTSSRSSPSSGALLVLGVWLGDQLFIGGPAGKEQAILFGVAFVVAALLGRRSARCLANRGLPRERCLFAGDERSFDRLREIFERHGSPPTSSPGCRSTSS